MRLILPTNLGGFFSFSLYERDDFLKEIVKLQNVYYEIKDNTILKDVNTSVQQGDIIGIIGKNGSGKSTLLQLLNNDLPPTAGKIQWVQQNVKLVMVEQEKESYSSEEKKANEVKLLEQWKVPNHNYQQLSGGEKLKARLAKGFSTESDLLLLDEPTNHLDELSIDFLHKQIKNYKGTILVVSHNRFFLDSVANKIWSIENNRLAEYRGNYSNYVEERKQKRLAQQRKYEKQQNMVNRIESQINELASWSTKAHTQSTKKDGFKEYYRVKAKSMDKQVKSKHKRLKAELEKAKVDPIEPEYKVRFSLNATNKIGRRFLEVKNISKSYNGVTLFHKVNFTIQHGEKVSIKGPNGSGKTTLLKVLMGLEQAKGDVWISPSAKIGYLTQEVFDLPLEQNPAQLFYKETFEDRGKVQTLMNHLGFNSSDWTKPIRYRSMGERVKLKLMEYILEEKDVLILDEPTNHLDLASREQLEDTLAQYTGTLLIVSHDRYFLEKTTSSELIISNYGIQKQSKDKTPKKDKKDELCLKLETERQEVLGQLSYMTPNNKEYIKLDKRFNELTKQINDLLKK